MNDFSTLSVWGWGRGAHVEGDLRNGKCAVGASSEEADMKDFDFRLYSQCSFQININSLSTELSFCFITFPTPGDFLWS